MKGFYFHNTDIRNTRAHTSQLLNTVVSIDARLSICLVVPRYYGETKLDLIKENHDLPIMPKVALLRNFGIRNSGIASFILFNLPAIWFLLVKKIKKEADFVYIRSSFFLPLVIAACMLRVPCYYETHRKPMSLSERCRDYIISNLVTGIVVASSYVRDYYLSYKKRILVAHDAVSLKRFAVVIDKKEARRNLGFMLDENICVYTGTISRLKGINYVIDAARGAPKVIFLLVGLVSPEFINADLPPNVRILGKKEQKELPAILHAANVLLLPHPNNEYSQSPMKLFEYMASGVPIVASRLPSISEVLNDQNAILVEANSGEALALGIQKAISDIDFSRAVAERAHNDVQNYTWEKRGIAIAEFIRNTMRIPN